MARAARRKLSPEAVFAAAVALADAEGLEALSMRKLAQALGVEAMSLYNHVPGKEALLDGMADLVVAEFACPDPAAPWRAEMMRRGEAAVAALLRHPWAPLVVGSRANPGPAMLAYVEATLASLAAAGFDVPLADHAWNAMDAHIYGFALQQIRFPFAPEAHAAVAAAYLPHLEGAGLPYLRAITIEVAEGRHDGIQSFGFGFGLLLDGLERLPRGPAGGGWAVSPSDARA